MYQVHPQSMVVPVVPQSPPSTATASFAASSSVGEPTLDHPEQLRDPMEIFNMAHKLETVLVLTVQNVNKSLERFYKEARGVDKPTLEVPQ